MSYLPPQLALIDDNVVRNQRFARLAKQLDISFRTFLALPRDKVPVTMPRRARGAGA